MSNVFIAILNPAICAILAVAMFLFWFHQREKVYIALLSIGFFALAVGFVLQYASVQLDGVVTRFVGNGALLVGVACVVAGTLDRVGTKVPAIPLVGISVSAVAGFTWFLLVDPNIAARVLIVNFASGFMILLLASELTKLGQKKPIDRFLVWFFLVWGLSFFPRTWLAVTYDGASLTDGNFFATLYWVTLTFSIAFFLLIFAVAIVAAIAIDLQEELRAEAFTDPLSGLLNRRGFNTRLESALQKAREQGSPIALIVADLDNFKEINDRFGHAVGDDAIVSFAKCLGSVTVSEHVAGRMGGEEFAVLLRGADIRMARLFAEGLRSSCAALDVPGLPADRALTASFGVAELEPGEDWEDLLRRADRALYRAKAEGRDRVVVCTSEAGALPADMGRPPSRSLRQESFSAARTGG